METRKSTTAGVLFWTPAPVRSSPTSSVASEDVWDDEDEDQAEKEDDFVSQMDENGIIGLSEALEEVELEETCGDADAEYNPNVYPGPLTPEKADLSGHDRDTPGELSYNLSEHLSHTESPREDTQVLSSCEDIIGGLTTWTADEMRQRREEQQIGCLPERVKYLDMTDEAKDGEKAGKRIDKKRKKNEPGTANGFAESYIFKEEMGKISSTPSCSVHLLAMEPVGVSSHHCPKSQPASPVKAPTFPQLPHLTAEEIAAAPGIENETFPEMSFIESLSESHKSHISPRSSPRCPEMKLKASFQPVAMFSEEMSNHNSGVSNGPLKGSVMSDKHQKRLTKLPRRTRQHPPEATFSSHTLSTVRANSLKCKQKTTSPERETRTPRDRRSAAGVNESRKGPLTYCTPDFSKVEPRVHFPKGGYKPPKSRRSSQRESLSPEPPLVFKSPADIVKEVLLNVTDGSPAPSDSYRPPASAPYFTVPQEFKCRQHATTLLEQLQEDYNTLLTKYAEAENTIDRLRLEAKVSLYSDAPKPGHLVQSGLNQEASRVMMLDIPQAQRAEINTASLHSNGHSNHQRSSSAGSPTRKPDPQVGQQPARILYSQADKFLQQLQTFEDLLKCKKVKPFEQMKGLSQLAEGLDSLERGYLLARDEHKLLQQQRAEISHFDPERELEGLIFQCGLRMEELREQVEKVRQEQPTCEAPTSPSPHPILLSVPSEGVEILTHPKNTPGPLLVDLREVTAVEVSSANEKNDEEMEDEETLNSLYLKPVNDKHKCVEQDFAKQTDHYQSFKELPKLLDRSQREGAPFPASISADMQPWDEEKERPCQGTGNLEVHNSLPQGKSDQQNSPPVSTSKQQTSRSGPPSLRASSQSTTLPVHPPSSRGRLEVGKSHSSSLSSLGELNALERRNVKLRTGSSRVLSQDGIISPEMDSGFVGSESSRLTPAAAPSPLHQRASESVMVPQERNLENPHTGPLSASSPASSPSHSCVAMEPREGSQLSPDQLRRTRQGQRTRTFSYSPKHWVSQTEHSRADSGTSEFGLESNSTHTVSEEEQNDQYTESINSLHSSSSSLSPAAQHRHGDSFRALSSSLVANRNDAIKTLQAEVNRLKERLESCLRNKKPPSSVRAAPSAQEKSTQHNISTPHLRSEEQGSDVSRGRRDRQRVDVVEETTVRQTTRRRSLCAHRQKPQLHLLTASERCTPQPQPLVSRCTQTSTAGPDSCSSHTNTVCSRAHPRQLSDVSIQVGETADEPDSSSRQAPLCPQCLSRHRGQPEGPVGGNREPTHAFRCRHCPLCRCPELYKSTEPECRRVSESPTHTRRQPAESRDGAQRSRHFAAAAPPALLQYMPVCQPPLLLYSSPLHISPSNSPGTSLGVRDRGGLSGRTRCSLSADRQSSVDSSLNRAIRAARHMKHTSGHMAHSLAAGLHYQELLTQSCSY